MSERFGRKYPLVGGVAVSSAFILMPAMGTNIQTILLGRFLAGLFGVSPIAVLGGVITDCWNAQDRGIAMAFCIGLNFSGPSFGPIIGNSITDSGASWRWTMWVTMIAGLAVSLLGLLTFPETYPPVILQRAAKRYRNAGFPEVRSKLEAEGLSIRHFARTYLIRPWCQWSISHPFVFSLLMIPIQISSPRRQSSFL